MDSNNRLAYELLNQKHSTFLIHHKNTSNCSFIKAICAMSFDDEMGQVTEAILPLNTLTDDNIKTITGLSFPETNSICEEGELFYMFKLRKDGSLPLKNISIDTQEFYYGFTLFKQHKDSSKKRGYLQKSIVIISETYNKLQLQKLLKAVSDIYLSVKTADIPPEVKLEKIYEHVLVKKEEINVKSIIVELLEMKPEEINKTMVNYKKATIENKNIGENEGVDRGIIEVNGTVEAVEAKIQETKITTKTKITTTAPSTSESSGFPLHFNLFPENNKFIETLTMFYLCKIWNIWELIITETPIVVYSDLPSICSEVVMLISSVIYPLEYLGDTRPYMTIYENDFRDYLDDVNLNTTHSSIVGVVNPFCLRSFENWPVVLKFDDDYFAGKGINKPFKTFDHELNSKMRSDSYIYYVETKRKLHVKPNIALIKMFFDFLELEGKKAYTKINLHLRMCLIDMTNDFMKTFEEFFMQQLDNIKRIIRLRKTCSLFEFFNIEAFEKYILENNIYFNMKYINDKSKTLDLYTRFTQTKLFNSYVHSSLKSLKDKILVEMNEKA